MVEEIWRPVVGFEGFYEVSSFGRVRNLKTKRILNLKTTQDGYKEICLHKQGNRKYIRVNRLVAFAFPEICGKHFEGAVCNHINEKKQDNRAENLEWCTVQYNTNYGTGIKRGAEKRSKPIAQYTLNNILKATYIGAAEAARQNGYCEKSISRCCRGERKRAYGFVWRYA